MNTHTKWSLATLLTALAAFFGGRATTTPSQPAPPTTPDSAVTAPPITHPETTVTPPPVITPIPPPSGSYTTLLADSARYTSTAQLLARISKNVGGTCTSNCLYTDGPNAGLATVDATVTYQGHPTIKYGQAAGAATIPEMWVGVPSSRHLWIREKLRWSPGWTTVGTGGGANAYKMFGWSFAGVDGSGRIEITNTSEYQLYFGWTGTPNAFDLKVGNIATEWTDGVWYDYIIELNFTDSKTGIANLWIAKDGQTPVKRGSITNTAVSGSVPAIAAVNFGMNFNQVRTGKPAQSLSYGQWEIVDGEKFGNPFGVK